MARTFAIAAAATTLIGLATGAFFVMQNNRHDCSNTVIAGGSATIGGPFELVTHTGQTVTDTEIITGPTLIYFGFTYCPDVCPLDTARNLEALDILSEKGIALKPVFITIDPARDTPPVLADYVETLDPNMIGLTGTAEQVKAASKAYKTYYRKNGEGDDYLMDHSTFSYLMDPSGFLEFYRRDTPPRGSSRLNFLFCEQQLMPVQFDLAPS